MRSTINRSALVFNWTCLSYASLSWDLIDCLFFSITAMKLTACSMHCLWVWDWGWWFNMPWEVLTAYFQLRKGKRDKLAIESDLTKWKAWTNEDIIQWCRVLNPRKLLSPVRLNAVLTVGWIAIAQLEAGNQPWSLRSHGWYPHICTCALYKQLSSYE